MILERIIQRITMFPHGYHHNGFMATPALGTQDVRLNIVLKLPDICDRKSTFVSLPKMIGLFGGPS